MYSSLASLDAFFARTVLMYPQPASDTPSPTTNARRAAEDPIVIVPPTSFSFRNCLRFVADSHDNAGRARRPTLPKKREYRPVS